MKRLYQCGGELRFERGAMKNIALALLLFAGLTSARAAVVTFDGTWDAVRQPSSLGLLVGSSFSGSFDTSAQTVNFSMGGLEFDEEVHVNFLPGSVGSLAGWAITARTTENACVFDTKAWPCTIFLFISTSGYRLAWLSATQMENGRRVAIVPIASTSNGFGGGDPNFQTIGSLWYVGTTIGVSPPMPW